MTDAKPAGLDFWMRSVLTECRQVRHNPEPGSIHDLRVALRRCRSIADGFISFDPHPAWKLMKTESRTLFRQLGSLRDTQVAMEWVARLMPEPDETSFLLRSFLEGREARCRESAAEAALKFDHKKWASWIRVLSVRTRRIPLEGLVFQHLALECLFEVLNLHRQAVRNRTQVAYHRLRIGLKKFRYVVESFLPSRHERWGTDLRALQDILGEMHDLGVLWRTAVEIRAMRNEKSRREWRRRISEETMARLERYSARTTGRAALFRIWLNELPERDEIPLAGLARFRTWASFRDPDVRHSKNVAKLALRIYDGLKSLGLVSSEDLPEARQILESAALAHAVGLSKTRKKHQILSYRMIRKFPPPLGLTPEKLRRIALVVRFHRGSLPAPHQKAWTGIPDPQRKTIVILSGILRLAVAFTRMWGKRIYPLEVKQTGGILSITTPGYSENDKSAVKLAASRHLLEISCRLLILITDIPLGSDRNKSFFLNS